MRAVLIWLETQKTVVRDLIIAVSDSEAFTKTGLPICSRSPRLFIPGSPLANRLGSSSEEPGHPRYRSCASDGWTLADAHEMIARVTVARCAAHVGNRAVYITVVHL